MSPRKSTRRNVTRADFALKRASRVLVALGRIPLTNNFMCHSCFPQMVAHIYSRSKPTAESGSATLGKLQITAAP